MEGKKSLSEIFKRIHPTGIENEIFQSATDIRLRISKEDRIAEIHCALPKLYRKSDIYALEDQIKNEYELNCVRLLPKYPPELFSVDYVPELLMEAARVGIIINGFFNKYEIEFQETVIAIKIPFSQGGISLLDLAKTGQVISNIIKSEFDLNYKVQIIQSESAGEQYAQFMSRQLERLNSETEHIRMEEKNARIAAEAAQKSETPEAEDVAPLPKVRTLFENSETNGKIEDGKIKSGKITFDISAPELIYGEAFPIVQPLSISDVTGTAKNVVVLGEVFDIQQKETKRGDKVMLTISITNKASSLYIKTTCPIDDAETPELFSKGKSYAVRGSLKKDSFDGDIYLQYTDIMKIKTELRTDTASEKRVELHLHTCMSQMDATIKADEIVNTAYRWGHKAVAITDHGNLQSFPVAMLTAETLKDDFKVLYGLEAYFVDDTSRAAYLGDEITFNDEFIVFDIETTGLSPVTCKITEIGAVLIQNGKILDRFNTFVHPGIPIPPNIVELTGITDEMVADAERIEQVLPKFLNFIGNRMLVAHNAVFDTGFIRQACEDCHLPFNNPYLDTVAMSRFINPDLKNHKLDTLAKFYNLGNFNHHRACDDAEMLAMIFNCMTTRLVEEGVNTIARMNYIMSEKSDPLKLKTYHQIILVKNQIGMKNLYKLVTDSYLKYYRKVPRIPKTRLEELREGLIVGSACEAGELFQAILEGKSENEILEIAKFYDYLEIQPVSNNRFMIEEGKVRNEEELQNLNRKIIEIGRKCGIPVCATCDAHYLNPEDEIYRRILLTGHGFKDADKETRLFFRNTEEMLSEFSYLDEATAREVVIENPNKIADMIEKVRPIPKGNYPPHIDGAEEELTEKCWALAKSLYGDPLPDVVSARLSRELDAIIQNGFAIMYIIARKLVENSESKGYQVGSRGSVGSSFAATMAGITRVNPLPPHYRCPKCQYTEFFEGGKYGSGFDLPDANCPKCGAFLARDGHDIPFETFLGFNGDKTPDIDLNFSGDVQADAHKFTEVLFGEGKAFKAGTIGTLADKTAYGYAAKFLEGRGVSVNRAEMDRLIAGCLGTKRTTGQHPGGIIVVPQEYDITDFSPVQHPADDPHSDIKTTHFEFKYLHDTILKLDILGHDIPTKCKRMEEYTGISVLDIPMSDPVLYKGFTSTEPLGVTPEQIDSKTSTLGLPEMGTSLSRNVLIEAQPKTFSDLLQIEGLTHGTGMWLGNAADLIKDGVCTVSEVIGCRDDIMLTLIHKYGMDKNLSFKIMEFVRKNKKGKMIPEEMTSSMIEHHVPQWYIDSLQKIRYMFPKAHAAAYAIDAIRLMWYKIYRPVEFYAGYFSAAPGGFDAEIVMQGKSHVRKVMTDLNQRYYDLSQVDKDIANALLLVNEYYQRGYEFLPVHITKSHAKKFVPENGKIRLPFSALPGVGETAAENVMAARDAGEVYSIEDLQKTAKVSKTVIEILKKNGALEGMSQTKQLSMF